MRTLARYTLSTGAAAALLVGCGGSLSSQSLPASRAATSTTPNTINTGWLYLADDPFSIGIVYILPFPDSNRSRAKAITGIGYAYGPCADSSGHVWLPVHAGKGPAVIEFAAGKTKAIGRLALPRATGVGECAVDTVSGNLAVAGTHSVNIFAQAKGKAANYSLGSTYVTACTYDGQGNLFVDGMKPISTSREAFVLYEMPAGSATFSSITLDKPVGYAGGLQWDGTYVAVATGGTGVRPVIYRFTVSGSKGTVVATIRPKGLNFQALFAVSDGRMVGTSGLYGSRIRLWPYPGGGQWQWEMRAFGTQGMAIAPMTR
jgi:hypothetical protein